MRFVPFCFASPVAENTKPVPFSFPQNTKGSWSETVDDEKSKARFKETPTQPLFPEGAVSLQYDLTPRQEPRELELGEITANPGPGKFFQYLDLDLSR